MKKRIVILSLILLLSVLSLQSVSAVGANSTSCGEVNSSFVATGFQLTSNILINDSSGNFLGHSCLAVTSDNVLLDGNGFQVIGNQTGFAINISDRSNVTLINFGNLTNFTSSIIYASSSTDVNVTNNTIVGDSLASNNAGIQFDTVTGSQIVNNKVNVTGSNSKGLVFTGTNTDIKILRNYVNASGESAVSFFTEVDDANVSYNVFTGAGGSNKHVMEIRGDNITVVFNNITSSAANTRAIQWGVASTSDSNNRMVYNNISMTGSEGTGFSFTKVTNSNISFNHITSEAGDAITIALSSNTNTFSRNVMYMGQAADEILLSGSDNNNFTENILRSANLLSIDDALTTTVYGNNLSNVEIIRGSTSANLSFNNISELDAGFGVLIADSLNVTVGSNFFLSGVGAFAINVSVGNSTRIIDNNITVSGNADRGIVLADSDYVTIVNNNITMVGIPNEAIKFANYSISGNVSFNTVWSNSSAGDVIGMYVDSNNNVFRNNHITNLGSANTIDIQNSTGNIFAWNNISSASSGISIRLNSASSTQISNNNLSGVGGDLIETAHGDSLSITANNFSSSGVGIDADNGQSLTVTGNTFNGTSTGIDLATITNSTFSTNNITTAGGTDFGFVLATGSDGNTFDLNYIVLSGTDDIAYDIDNSNFSTISNNNFSGTGASAVGLDINDASWNSITNNNFKTPGNVIQIGATAPAYNNDFRDNILHSLTAHAFEMGSVTNSTAVTNDVVILGDTGAGEVISGGGPNTTFLNVSFAKAELTITEGSLDVNWYLNVHVQDGSGSAVDAANVTVHNSSLAVLLSNDTNASGDISQKIITEFTETSAGRVVATPHTINGSLSGYTDNGTVVNITATNNTNTVLVLPVISSSTTTTTTTSGGGGGSSTSTVTDRIVRTLGTIGPDNPVDLDIDKDEIPVENIYIELNKVIENTKITVQGHNGDLPDSVPVAPEGELYVYYEIIPTRFSNDDIASGVTTIKVDKDWVDSNGGHDAVQLQRYDNGWETLTPRFLQKKDGYYLYEVDTDELSVFAITASLEAVADEDGIDEETTAVDEELAEEEPVEELVEPVQKKKVGTTILGVILAIVALVLLGWLGHWLMGRNKKGE